MNFFFPDSQDLVDPGFDFVTETYSEYRVRQRDDCYAHEVLTEIPFDGILVSKAIVDGVGADKPGKYSLAQRHRLRRAGVRKFFRAPADLLFMGDCGAYSYKDEVDPPYSVAEVVEFYDECGFDFGISVDHLILKFEAQDSYLPGFEPDLAAARQRQELTLDLAADFFALQSGACFSPVGVAQGWSPASYADAVVKLQAIGFSYIAVGSMVPLRTRDILQCLEAIGTVRSPATKLHLLGVTRLEHIEDFARYGVASFDSTSPLLQAFKDGQYNYYTADAAYPAVRIPQVDGNAKLRAAIRSGRVDGSRARVLEQAALARLREYDRHHIPLVEALSAVRKYVEFVDVGAERLSDYETVLSARPWQACPCEVCQQLGIEVILFRGSERNKRRGFHNLHVFRQRLLRRSGAQSARNHFIPEAVAR
jgi:hypothetical protein